MVIRVIVLALMSIGASVRLAHAQAWVGEPKSLVVDLVYQYVPATATIIQPGSTEGTDIVSDRPETNHVYTLGVEYIPIKNLSVEAALPLAMVKYTGTAPHSPVPGVWDDGKFHTTLTDLLVGVRYQILDEPIIALTPQLSGTIPVGDYEVNGFATGGRHLAQLHAGASAGRHFDPVLPNLYLTGSYEFTFSERNKATVNSHLINQNRSDVSAELGYQFLDSDLIVNVAWNWRIAHGGINFTDFPKLPPDLQANHDVLLAEEFMFVGGGVSYAITDKLTIGAITRFFVRGYNTKKQNLYGLNLFWTVL